MRFATLRLTTLWKRLFGLLGICFDLSGVMLDDAELRQQLGFGRE